MRRPLKIVAMMVMAGVCMPLGAWGGMVARSGLQPEGGAPKEGKPAAPAAPAVKKDLIDTLAGDKNFSTLVSALRAADLIDALRARGPFTIMAPTNDAFAKLPKGELERLLKPENKAALQALLKYHVIPAKVTSAQFLRFSESSKTLEGRTFRIVPKGGQLRVGPDDQNLAAAVPGQIDLDCGNGVIHAIDGVMIPPKAPTLHLPPVEPN